MRKEVADKWIEALTNGRYKQGTGKLRNTDQEFCCLGVLCDISEQGSWVHGMPGGAMSYVAPFTKADYEAYELYPGSRYLARSAELLPTKIARWAGLQSDSPSVPLGEDYRERLITLNDQKGMTFQQIAEVIMRHWEAL